jgi:site-specific recombinase XerD
MVMGKGRKERALLIAPRTAQHIWRYLATRDDAARDRAFLFATRQGTRMSRYSLRRLIKRIGERAGVPAATVHRFRHTFAIEFLRNHPNAYALQAMLGHSSLKMVNRYLFIAQADLDRAHRHGSPVINWNL